MGKALELDGLSILERSVRVRQSEVGSAELPKSVVKRKRGKKKKIKQLDSFDWDESRQKKDQSDENETIKSEPKQKKIKKHSKKFKSLENNECNEKKDKSTNKTEKKSVILFKSKVSIQLIFAYLNYYVLCSFQCYWVCLAQSPLFITPIHSFPPSLNPSIPRSLPSPLSRGPFRPSKLTHPVSI